MYPRRTMAHSPVTAQHIHTYCICGEIRLDIIIITRKMETNIFVVICCHYYGQTNQYGFIQCFLLLRLDENGISFLCQLLPLLGLPKAIAKMKMNTKEETSLTSNSIETCGTTSRTDCRHKQRHKAAENFSMLSNRFSVHQNCMENEQTKMTQKGSKFQLQNPRKSYTNYVCFCFLHLLFCFCWFLLQVQSGNPIDKYVIDLRTQWNLFECAIRKIYT